MTTIVLVTTPFGPHGSLQSPSGTQVPMQSTTNAITYGESMDAVEPINEVELVETTTSAPELIEDSTNAAHVLESDSGTRMWKETIRLHADPHDQSILKLVIETLCALGGQRRAIALCGSCWLRSPAATNAIYNDMLWQNRITYRRHTRTGKLEPEQE